MKRPIRIPAVVRSLLERLGIRPPPPSSTASSPIPATDDRVRQDGGKSTDDQHIPEAALAKVKRNAIEHSKDEPGS